MKTTIYYISIFILVISCQERKKNQDLGFIETKPFSKNNYYKYDNGFFRNKPQDIDSFRSYIYTIVEPLEEDENLPKRIFGIIRRHKWKKSINYFDKELKGKNLSYLEINNKIVFRNFYFEYRLDSDFDKFTNLESFTKYLKSKNLDYKVIKSRKINSINTLDTDEIDIEIQKKFYKVILNERLGVSYLFYDRKDTVNFDVYRTNLIDFFR
ncbi:hypothetical protein D1J36_001690 [Riemerella anatipestifer]|uniref:hypothetical protein n=1 Tax=Riemerella anatipestifer TaxID=34085 RepID=UPI0012AE8ED1|nr:hypothetical protein [Riemerella anatipestifer]USL95848.1 hypothetical protein D1J36_001690 [Riemerella anatipestifer]